MMKSKEEIDYKLAAEQLRSGKPLFGKDGALAPMLERILNAALEGEMDAHLSEESRESGNRRNGKIPKTVQTQYGEVTVETPRDRDGSFDPQTVRKRETILAEGMADQIIGMYAFGTSTREISKYFEREFNTRLSAETISAITDRVLPEIKEWKSRSLDAVYAICWLDAILYKVKDDSGRSVTRAIYNVLGINKEGHKELLGMYVAKSEGANFWLEVLTDLQNRGVEDIMICSVDGLKGFPDAIQSVFPNTVVQLCIVHQIRNSIKYVGSKHQKEFLRDLKLVYGAVSKEAAEAELDKLEAKWGERYPIVPRGPAHADPLPHGRADLDGQVHRGGMRMADREVRRQTPQRYRQPGDRAFHRSADPQVRGERAGSLGEDEDRAPREFVPVLRALRP